MNDICTPFISDLAFFDSDEPLMPEGFWKILIVDDEPDVHRMTRLVIGDIVFDAKGLQFLSAYSVKDAQKKIIENPDVAVILVDIVMETDSAGLDFIRFVRGELNNDHVQIIVRTGQPGVAPERKVILEYAINDYRSKTELTSEKFFTVMISALRAYQHSSSIKELNSRLAEELASRGRVEDEIRLLNADLEQKVLQRTEELELANRALKLTNEKTKRLAESARSANRAKSSFLANMSHEIRTPMNGIIGMIHLINETSLTDEQSEYINIIKSSSDSLLSIINEILDYAKIEAGKVDIAKNDFNLSSLVSDIVDLLAVRAHEKSIDLFLVWDDEIPETVCGDYTRIRQILMNLVSNAIKFTEEGEVIVQAALEKKEGSNVRIKFRVIDSGMGIPEDKIHLLFKSFSQVASSATSKIAGTGLGLAISRRLVHAMGGKIGCRSVKGAGSVFWFWLDLEEKITAVSPAVEIARNLKTCIVCSSPIHSGILRSFLDPVSSSIRTVNSLATFVSEILHAEKKVDFDAIVFDHGFADSEIFEDFVIKLINTQGFCGEIISLVPAGFRYQRLSHYLGNSFTTLSKPVRKDALLAAVRGAKIEKNNSCHGAAVLDEKVPIKSGLSLLVVEDNRVSQMVAVKLLKRFSCSVDVVSNGFEAISRLSSNTYDAVFMDVHMPGMDGFEATRLIRSAKIPQIDPGMLIIAMTANAMKGDDQRCFKEGMNDYISKPIQPENVRFLLEKYFKE